MIFDRIMAGSDDAVRYGPLDDFWYEGLGQDTESGVKIDADHALRISAVFACIRIIAETVASLPLHIYRRMPNGDREIAREHPLYTVLHDTPNTQQSSFEWRELMQGHLTLRGDSYSRIISGPRGFVDELWPLHSDRVQVEKVNRANGTFGKRYRYWKENGQDEIIPEGEILHLPGLSFDGYKGLNPIEYQREALGLSAAAEAYGARFFKNDARPRGVLQMPGTFKDEAALQRFKRQWHDAYGGSNQHKTAVLEGGMEYKQMGMSHEDAQFLETRKYQVEEIARIFRIPPHMLASLERATFSNIEHQSIDFVVHTLRPWLVRWEQRIARSLIVATDRYFAEFDVNGLLRGDQKTRFEAYQSAINTGWMTRNEVRRKENLNPLPGLDRPLTPLNMSDGTGEQADAILSHAVAQIVRREVSAIRNNSRMRFSQNGEFQAWVSEFFHTHVRYVSDHLSIHKDRARLYCDVSQDELLEAANDTKSLESMLVRWEVEKPARLIQIART